MRGLHFLAGMFELFRKFVKCRELFLLFFSSFGNSRSKSASKVARSLASPFAVASRVASSRSAISVPRSRFSS